MAQRLRIFISSPGDVPDERLRADLIIDKLAQDYSRYFAIESYRWEHEPMLASGHFQDAIEPPSASDIVILILWSRLGTPLPEKTPTREYRGLDGRAPVTGTEWEFEEALAAARARGAPDILVFRNLSPAVVDLRDPVARSRGLAQLDALDAFWKRYFADRGVFLAASAEYLEIDDFARRLEKSLRRLIERRMKSGAAPGTAESAPTWLGNPFRGLASYEFEHAAIFFGRDALVAKAAEQLATQARAGSAFLLLVGGSGSGKSSLVKAAVVPRLMKPQRIEGVAFLRRVVFRPGSAQQDLILGLAKALTQGAAQERVGLPELLAPGQTVDDLAAYLRGSIGASAFVFSTALGRVTEAARASKRILPHESAKLILVIDQFEELFTLARITAEDRTAFVRLLQSLARSGVVWIIASMRADFWHRILDVPELVALAQGQGRLEVPPPSPAEVAEMIRKPAQAAGLTFQTHPQSGLGLDTVLAEDAASEPGVLPLLSFALDELYSEDVHRCGGNELCFRQYEVLGGLAGAIAKRADQILDALPEKARAASPRVLRALATLGGVNHTTPVARSVPLDSFPLGSETRMVVDAFIEGRLLVASTEGETAIVRIAHEALISRWKRASDQLTADRRDLEMRALIERQYARWREADEKVRPQLLLRDPDLANALDLQERWGDELDADVQRFIAQSHQRSRRRHQLAAAAAIVFGIVALAATGFGGLAYHALQRADHERARAVDAEASAIARRDQAMAQRNAALVAQSRYLASEADNVVKDGSARSALALLRAALPDPGGANPRPLVRDAVVAAYRALYANRERRQMAMPAGATAVAADAAAKKIVIATPKELFVRDGLSAEGQRVLAHGAGPVSRIVIAEKGERLALIGGDGSISVRDLAKDGQQRSCHGPEGAGAQAYFLQSGRRLLVASSDQKVWRLFDADTCQELASREFAAPAGKGAAFLVDGGRRLIVAVVDGRLHRLSPDDLSDLATGEIEPAAEYALALTPDGKSICVALAKDTLTGQIVVLDAETLAPQRSFGKVTGGARHIAVAPNSKWLAVHGIIGIDFFDVRTGERMYRMLTNRDAVRGRFLGGSASDYVAYGTHGFVRRYAPELGVEMAAYRNSDAGTIEQLDELPDRSGFLTVSDRPSVTEWSFDAQIISRQHAVPLVLQGLDMRMPAQIEAFWIAGGGKEVLAAYIDRSARRWMFESGEMRLVREAAPRSDSIEHAALIGGVSVLAEKSGRLLIYTEAGGSDRPAAELAGEPLSYLGEIDATRAFAVSKSGVASIIDLSTVPAPKVDPIPALGACLRQAAIAGLALCVDDAGTMRLYRPADGRLLLDWPPPAGAKLSAADISPDGSLIAASYSNGELEVRSLADGNTLAKQTVNIKLTGETLKAAAQSPLLSDENRSRIRRGATELEVALGANRISLSAGGTHVALAMPDRTIQIIELATGKVQLAKGGQRGLAADLDFSPNGALLAAIEAAEYRAMNVYEVATGERLVSVSLSSQASPRLRRLNNGHGFATIDQTGRIMVHPVFQDVQDLIAYLAREFPEPLTPRQRRAYFIE